MASLLALPSEAAPVRNFKARAGDCVACHKAAKVLPDEHVPTKDLELDDCEQCHAPRSDKALTGRVPLDHLHGLKGVTCAQCHGVGKRQAVPALEQCVSCHGSTAKLAEKTANVKPENPHDSPHWGPNMECTACHHVHEKSQSYCAYCHTFGFRVP